MIDLLGVHRLDETNLVGDRANAGQEFAEPSATLAVLAELELRRLDRQFLLGGHCRQPLAHAHRRRQLLAAPRLQARLVVEQIGVGGRAGLGEINHPLSFGRKLWEACPPTGRRLALAVAVAKQRGQCRRADARGTAPKELAPRKRQPVVRQQIHS